jgi:hypothetical protein
MNCSLRLQAVSIPMEYISIFPLSLSVEFRRASTDFQWTVVSDYRPYPSNDPFPIRRVPKGLYGFPMNCSLRLQAVSIPMEYIFPYSTQISPIRRVPKGLYGFPMNCSLRLQAVSIPMEYISIFNPNHVIDDYLVMNIKASVRIKSRKQIVLIH